MHWQTLQLSESQSPHIRKFSKLWGRFTAAFVIQLFGFVGTFVMASILNNFIKGSSVPIETQTIYGFLPFVFSIMISLIIRYIYNVKYFDDKKFFKSFSN